jgi:hypothetical protein
MALLSSDSPNYRSLRTQPDNDSRGWTGGMHYVYHWVVNTDDVVRGFLWAVIVALLFGLGYWVLTGDLIGMFIALCSLLGVAIGMYINRRRRS